jgi:hypothetical protein
MFERYNFVFLTGALVILLALIALAREVQVLLVTELLYRVLIVLTLSVAAWSVSSKTRWRVTGIGFVTVLAVLTIVGQFLRQAGLDILWLTILFVYLLLITVLTVQQVLFTGSIDWNKVAGALGIFLMIGLIWSVFYMIIAELNPGAFSNVTGVNWDDTFPDLIYFSFVTLTTLGYGDITPLTPMGRYLALMQAMIGQLYIAVVVASLVGIRIAEEMRPAETRNQDR